MLFFSVGDYNFLLISVLHRNRVWFMRLIITFGIIAVLPCLETLLRPKNYVTKGKSLVLAKQKIKTP